jgi:hypothetical protein
MHSLRKFIVRALSVPASAWIWIFTMNFMQHPHVAFYGACFAALVSVPVGFIAALIITAFEGI